jgi:hypothetical protein
VLWISIVVLTYTLFIANIPAYFASLHLLHAPNVPAFTGQLTLVDVHTLQAWGLSLDFYATCMVGISLLFQFSYAAVGALLFWRKSDTRIALFTSFALMMLPFGFANLTLQALPPHWSWFIPALSALGDASLLLCAFVFPDGRFVPRCSSPCAGVSKPSSTGAFTSKSTMPAKRLLTLAPSSAMKWT